MSAPVIEAAAPFILAYLREHGPTSAEDLVDAAIAAGIPAKSPRAFGPVFQFLWNRGDIRHVDYKPRRKAGNARDGRVWGLGE